METFEGSLVRVARGEIRGQLNETTTPELDIVQGRHKFLMQEYVARTHDVADETDDWGWKTKLIDHREAPRQYSGGRSG
jgi:hypothetical protein